MIEFESKLSSYLVKILEGEKSVEILRQALARIPQFTPYSVFKRIDRENKKFITLNDFKRFFFETSVIYKESNLSEFFSHFDRDRDYIINYQEFLNIILPQNDPDLRALVTQREALSSQEIIGYEVEYALVRLLEKELNLIDIFTVLAQDLRICRDFSVTYAFRTLDYFKYNYIETKGLEIFLRSNGYLLSPIELKSLVFRLDRDGDGKITFTEFEEIFYLKSNYEGRITNSFSSSLRKNDEAKTLSGDSILKQSNFGASRILSPPRRENLNNSFLRESFNDINFKASMNTYTSPTREIVKKTISEQDISSSNRITSPIKIINSSPKKNNLSNTLLSPLRQYNQRIETLTNMNTYTYHSKTNLNINNNNNSNLASSNSPLKTTGSPKKLNTSSNLNVTNDLNPPKTDLSLYLTRFFSELIQNENKLETSKENLSLLPDIVLNDLYKLFDSTLIGYIGMLDFKDGLKALDIFSSLEEVKLLFKRYDNNQDGRLTFNEFANMVSPKKYEYLKIIQRRVGSETSISYESKFTFIKLLRLIIDTEQSIDLSRQFLSNKHFFNTYEAYDIIKGKYKSYIIKEDLRQFLYQNSIFVTTLELDLLYDRFDKDKDGRITFEEFIHEVLPKNN